MTNPLLPQQILEVLQHLRPVFHASSFESFLYLITGLLLGKAQFGIVRSSLYAPKGYNWRRLHDFLRRNRWCEIDLMAKLTGMVLGRLYPEGFPPHLFWIFDATYLEKVYARTIEKVQIHRRPHPKTGQGRRLKGHGLMLVAHLYQKSPHRLKAFLLGGYLYFKQATFVELAQKMVQDLPAPQEVHNIYITDRGLTAIKLIKTIKEQEAYFLGRIKRNATFYLPARPEDYKGIGRRPTYGEKFRADAAPKRKMQREDMKVPVLGKLKDGIVHRGTFLRRGFKDPIELIRVQVKGFDPWLLMLTDETLGTEAAIWAYYGRSQIEVAISESKALGLDAYRGRREAGIKKWPMIIGVVHCLLQLMGVDALHIDLQKQAWPWYKKENTVGSIHRRFIWELLKRHFFDLFQKNRKLKEMPKVA